MICGVYPSSLERAKSGDYDESYSMKANNRRTCCGIYPSDAVELGRRQAGQQQHWTFQDCLGLVGPDEAGPGSLGVPPPG